MWITQIEGCPKRVNHAAVAIGHKIYSFGGYCTGENSKDYTSMDVHVLNTATFRWTRHPVSDLPYFEYDDIVPYKRYGHTAVVYGDKIYIWGGRNDRTSCSVLFCFDTVWHCWTAPKTDGCIPPARDGHTACVWKNYMYIFGGYCEDSNSYTRRVFRLNLDTMEWSLVKTKKSEQGEEPDGRDFHSAVCLNDRMYVFGGREQGSPSSELFELEFYSNKMWYLNLQTFRWHLCATHGAVPPGRRSLSMVVYKEKIYIFGGFNSLKREHYNVLHEFDPQTCIWREVKALGKRPCRRRRQACCVVGDRLFIFGGTSPQLKPITDNVNYRDDDRLVDLSDMHVFDFQPTLKTLAILAVKKYNLDDSILPVHLKSEIINMFLPNKISVNRPNNSAG